MRELRSLLNRYKLYNQMRMLRLHDLTYEYLCENHFYIIFLTAKKSLPMCILTSYLKFFLNVLDTFNASTERRFPETELKVLDRTVHNIQECVLHFFHKRKKKEIKELGMGRLQVCDVLKRYSFLHQGPKKD
uniref:Uncharacterized protein n=1 Tax=Timema cristinae TaxID=61476 RepID=A0A7R9GPT8_TIMCR|nr:unnamed protein product [Timema cristinae]